MHSCNLLLVFKINVVFLLLELVQLMNAFDRAMNLLDDKFSFLASTKQIVSSTNNEDKVNMPPNDCTILIPNVTFFTTRQFRDFQIFLYQYRLK
jgi:hypothetical protein